MPEVRVQWIGKRRFVGVDSTNHSVVLSSADPEQGGIGMKPAELLLVALGGCTAYDVVSILEKQRQPLKGLEIRVSGVREPDPPWTYVKIHVHYRLQGRDLKPKKVAKAIELSEEKYCSVSNTVKGKAQVTTSFEIVDEETGEVIFRSEEEG